MGNRNMGQSTSFTQAAGSFPGQAIWFCHGPKKCTYPEARELKMQKLKWFRGPKGRLLRTKVRPHVQTEQSNRTRCGLCNVKNSNNVGRIKTFVLCKLVMYRYVMMQKCSVPVVGTSGIMKKIYLSALTVEWSRAAAEKIGPTCLIRIAFELNA